MPNLLGCQKQSLNSRMFTLKLGKILHGEILNGKFHFFVQFVLWTLMGVWVNPCYAKKTTRSFNFLQSKKMFLNVMKFSLKEKVTAFYNI